MSPEDIEAMTYLISSTVAAVMQQQQQQQAATGAQPPGLGRGIHPRIDEKFYRKIPIFNGGNWKDFSFKFHSATRGSCEEAHKLLKWAEQQSVEITDFEEFADETENTERISSELFNTLTVLLAGEPLQLLHNCNYNGAEAWRKLAKRYSPSTPLRAMQLMLQVVSPEKVKQLKDVPNRIESWETRIMVLERDSKEIISTRMKAAILLSMVPADIRDALIQQAEKCENYTATKERVISIVEARMAMK